MAVIVVAENGDIAGSGLSAERGDFQGEKGLIKVVTGPGQYDFFYIGTKDRDSLVFVTIDLPEGFDAREFKYVDGALVKKGKGS